MRISKLWAILAPAALLLATTPVSFADQFNFFNLGNDNTTFYGFDSGGTAYFTASNGLTTAYYNGAATGSSYNAAPVNVFAGIGDSGTACSTAAPAGTQFVSGRCNNGFDAYSAQTTGTPVADLYFGTTNIWGTGIGPFSPAVRVFGLNSVGNIIFADQSNENWYEAIRVIPLSRASLSPVATTVPEPATFLLLATGILTPLFFLRRRTPSPSL